jgi:hypothetical protein
MTIRLTDEQSIAYLDGGWEAYRVEEEILDYIDRKGVTEPVAVLLSDGIVGFYVADGEVL